jgi:putative salt-induced outer membrane protein YdiY
MFRSLRPRLVAGMAIVALTLSHSPGNGWAAEEKDSLGWSGEVNLNAANLTGTNDTFAGSVIAELAREWEKDKLSATAKGYYGFTRDRRDDPSDENTTQNAQNIEIGWNRKLSGRFFWETLTWAGRDAIQDINFQYRLASGPGYRFWEGKKKDKEHLDLSSRVGYRFLTFRDSTGEDTRQLVDLIAGFEYKNLFLEERLEFTHTGEVLLPANDIDSWVGKTGITLGVPITAAWSMRLGFEVEYQSRTPERVTNFTTRTNAGLVYKF